MVIKRNGEKVQFDEERILKAVEKANTENMREGKEYLSSQGIRHLVKEVMKRCDLNQSILVEEIQDLVEEELMKVCPSLARTYVRYRYKKEVARQFTHDFFDGFGKKLRAEDVRNQNANVDEYSFGGRVGEASSLLTKQYALKFCMSDKMRKNHEENRIYIHDLDNYAIGSHNCLTLPFDDLLANGFNTRQADVRPANSISTAMQLIAVIFQIQSLQQFGGVSASHIDWTLVPYLKKSFIKHFKRGVKYIYSDDEKLEVENVFDDINLNDFTIDLLASENIYTEILSKYSKAYQFAIDATNTEMNQAAEGLYHNLKIWVA